MEEKQKEDFGECRWCCQCLPGSIKHVDWIYCYELRLCFLSSDNQTPLSLLWPKSDGRKKKTPVSWVWITYSPLWCVFLSNTLSQQSIFYCSFTWSRNRKTIWRQSWRGSQILFMSPSNPPTKHSVPALSSATLDWRVCHVAHVFCGLFWCETA